ncbi:hypothetical protein Y1Q_0019983 [Alligator mississippiensis]|uniref:Uncharacterized protein n=1 Tax=Alligator mississippiensis TaxID=8496 RepID=A0A151PDU5_ALLMI|nr:hypothetical protein Y1Q_0019983 [Alligator mississippiensis]
MLHSQQPLQLQFCSNVNLAEVESTIAKFFCDLFKKILIQQQANETETWKRTLLLRLEVIFRSQFGQKSPLVLSASFTVVSTGVLKDGIPGSLILKFNPLHVIHLWGPLYRL